MRRAERNPHEAKAGLSARRGRLTALATRRDACAKTANVHGARQGSLTPMRRRSYPDGALGSPVTAAR
jgi:hypothetical protein